MTKNVEEQVEDRIKAILDNNNIKFYHKTESINAEIDKALKTSLSKQGNFGGNYPDIKLLINDIPIMIEVKGGFDRLVKFNKNTNSVDIQSFNNISNYAINGAIHYANNIVSNSNYNKCIAIGITGWFPNTSKDLQILLGVYIIRRDEPLKYLRNIKTIDNLMSLLQEKIYEDN